MNLEKINPIQNAFLKVEREKGKLVAKNVAINLSGQFIPVVVALLAVPVLIQNLGAALFGIFALAGAVIGFSNLFDLGIGQAVVREIVEKTAQKEPLDSTVSTSFWMTLILGTAVGLSLFLGADLLANSFLEVDPALRDDVNLCLKIISIAIPFVVSTPVLRGTVESTQRFDLINLVQIPIATLTYLLPAVVSSFSLQIHLVIAPLLILRVIQWLSFLFINVVSLKIKLRPNFFNLIQLKSLLSFGFWVLGANLVQPILTYLDRIVISSVISVTALTFYSAPMEIVQRLWIIPGALTSVIYPAFVLLMNDKMSLVRLYDRSLKFVFLILFPIVMIISVFSSEILSIWINASYGNESARLLQGLAIALIVNCLGVVPLMYLRAAGRPSVPAKLYIIEVIIYIPMLWFFATYFGLAGIAIGWFIRVLIDTVGLLLLSNRLMKHPTSPVNKVLVVLASVGLVFAVGFLPLSERITLVTIALVTYVPITWLLVLNSDEQSSLLSSVFGFLFPTVISKTKVAPPKKLIKSVGIAMAAYKPNVDFFVRQIESIQRQTFSNWICIICFDSDSNEVTQNSKVQKILEDPRFIVSQNPARLGFKKNFERALVEVTAKGVDAVSFADQDDYWYPEKLQVLVGALEQHGPLSLVHSDMRVLKADLNGESRIISESCWKYEGRQVEDQTIFHLLLRNCVTGAACLFDAELAKKSENFAESVTFHDHWLAILAASYGGVHPVNQVLYDYIQHGNNVVGVSPSQTSLKIPYEIGYQGIAQKAYNSWQQTNRTLNDCLDRGMKVPKTLRFVLKFPYDFGLILLVFGFLLRKVDHQLSQTCLAKGIGKFVSVLPSSIRKASA